MVRLSDEITDSRLLGEYRLLLSEEERRQQVRFHFERDRHRAMVRTVLSKYIDISPSDWRFTASECVGLDSC